MNAIAAAERSYEAEHGTKIERAFEVLWLQNQFWIPGPIRQHVFAAPRRYRFDFAWPAVRVAVEMEGGIYLQVSGGKSRHVVPAGMIEDMRKYNLAASLGWLVFRFERRMLDESGALQQVANTIACRLRTAGLTVADLMDARQMNLGEGNG